MDVETYALSRLYLARYRLLRDMRDLIRIAKEQSDKIISNDDLTFEWYVKQYLQHKVRLIRGREKVVISQFLGLCQKRFVDTPYRFIATRKHHFGEGEHVSRCAFARF